jgi:hypothetical protein
MGRFRPLVSLAYSILFPERVCFMNLLILFYIVLFCYLFMIVTLWTAASFSASALVQSIYSR